MATQLFNLLLLELAAPLLSLPKLFLDGRLELLVLFGVDLADALYLLFLVHNFYT